MPRLIKQDIANDVQQLTTVENQQSLNSNPILTYNDDVVLGTSDDELLADDESVFFGAAEPPAVLDWGGVVVCGTDQGEIVGLYDEGDSEVMGLAEPPAVLDWSGVVGSQS